MARSPFSGTFQPNLKPTVVTAPDALVYINGEQDLIGCSNCRRKFDLGKYITSIQVNLDMDSVPGSATINLSVPRHVVDDFFFDGIPIISPMMEVEIFAKGYFLLEGIPQYYPIFWGIVTEVSDSYSGGETTVTINCADILKWWEICRMNVNAAFTAPSGQMGRSIFGNVLFGTNPYDVIFSLSQMAFGDVILATGSLVSLYKEERQRQTFNAALGDIMAYWSSRFSKMRSNLLLYGIQGVAVRGDTLSDRYQNGQVKKVSNFVSSAIRQANGANPQATFDPASPEVTAFRTQFGQAGTFDFWQHDYQTKLEIANACKEAIGFEFYMDVTGDIVFKPPFYNLDILSNKPVSWVQDIDVIDWDFNESEAEVVTQMTIQGSFEGNVDYGFGPEITPFTSVTDYHLLRQYGWRPHSYNSEFMGNDLQMMFNHGLDVLDRINSRRHQGTLNIPLRPELRLGFPVYVAGKDQVWYVRGINHNIQFGGRATTTLSLTARRGKFMAPRGISTLKVKSRDPINVTTTSGPPSPSVVNNSTYELDLGDAATVPSFGQASAEALEAEKPLVLRHPKTGRIVGYPNVVMVYSRPYEPSATGAEAGQKAPGANNYVPKKNKDTVAENQKINAREAAEQFTDDATQQMHKYAHNRYVYGLNSAGVYVYAHDKNQYISQMSLLPEKNITVIQDGATVASTSKDGMKSPTTMVRPVSDERGFEVIGHYRYGRGISLRDGSLVLNEGKPNSRTGFNNVGDIQLALSGDLFATLNAQSQGLTTGMDITNPADTVARLVPEDLQTAAVLVPGQDGSKEPQFTDTGTNFVDTAPLGSPEQKGLPISVEASQLSRALTLAEMTVKQDSIPGQDTCECQVGRADLTFISSGYQVRNLRESSPTIDDLLSGDLGSLGATTETARLQPFSPNLKGSEVAAKVETYLYNLYAAMDDLHQAHENNLRGDPEGDEPSTRQLPDLFTPQDSTDGGFEPPFSALNRAALGDPKAAAIQGKSSREDMTNQIRNFGDDLRKATKAKSLGQQVSNLKAQLDRLRRRLSQVESEGPTTIGNTDDPNVLREQITKTEQDLAQKEGELALLV